MANRKKIQDGQHDSIIDAKVTLAIVASKIQELTDFLSCKIKYRFSKFIVDDIKNQNLNDHKFHKSLIVSKIYQEELESLQINSKSFYILFLRKILNSIFPVDRYFKKNLSINKI